MTETDRRTIEVRGDCGFWNFCNAGGRGSVAPRRHPPSYRSCREPSTVPPRTSHVQKARRGMPRLNDPSTGEAVSVAVIGQLKLMTIAMLIVSTPAPFLRKPRPAD